jgi:hypothetical protein
VEVPHDVVDEQPEAWAMVVAEFFFEKKMKITLTNLAIKD